MHSKIKKFSYAFIHYSHMIETELRQTKSLGYDDQELLMVSFASTDPSSHEIQKNQPSHNCFKWLRHPTKFHITSERFLDCFSSCSKLLSIRSSILCFNYQMISSLISWHPGVWPGAQMMVQQEEWNSFIHESIIGLSWSFVLFR